MQANKTITINGRTYDAVTGVPVEAPTKKKVARGGSVASGSVHSSPQRSQTLHRRSTKKPTPLAAKRPASGRHMDIARSGSVKRFAAHPAIKKTDTPASSATPDIPHKPHPAAQRAHKKAAAKKPAPAKEVSAKQVKDAAIAAALDSSRETKTKKPKESKKVWRWSRRSTIIAAFVFVLLGGIFITYLNLPSLSVAIAANQSGVDATYPKYVPDGYGLSQPVTFADGEVGLTFTSNAGTGEYKITQSESSWDSTAVLENVVREAAGDNYVINQERGLTIYTYDGNAAWVNGGILYAIESDAPLSGDQIRRIATSL